MGAGARRDRQPGRGAAAGEGQDGEEGAPPEELDRESLLELTGGEHGEHLEE
jgi:hypothetical protein